MLSKFFFSGILFVSLFFMSAELKAAPTITVTQTQLPAGQGDVNQRILLINITGASGTLNTISVTMNGTTSIANVSTVKIYATGTSNRFATTTLFGSIAAASGTLAITGTNTLVNGSNNYFWLAYDVVAGATEGNVLDATCTSIKIGGATTSVPSGNPAGSSPILLANKPVFLSNDVVTDGGSSKSSQYFRIPAIITAANGDLVTATDARFTSASDLPSKADIVIKRSTDKGQTWLAPQTIADLGSSIGAGDASLILDKTNNNIICLFASNNGLAASTPSNPIRLRMCKSTDNGVTWAAPVDITNQIYGSGCSDPTRKNWYAVWVASGRQLQLNSGPKSGRLMAAVGVIPDNGGTAHLNNTVIYSDDHGTTWNVVNALTNVNSGDESKLVQLNNGNIMMSSRTNTAGPRKFRTSTDLGATWGAQVAQSNINDPRCDGDFVRFASTNTGDNMDILLHTLPDNSASRQNLTVFISLDEGQTWPSKKTVFPGLAQYSSITRLSDNTIGMYYEMADPGAPFEMYFARFSLNWLGITSFTTLPVHLVNFNGQLHNNQSDLSWVSQSETNFKGYEIESSADGISFNKIGFLPASNNGKTNSYSFTDKFPAAGANYYRLKMIDIDGKATYSSIVKLYVNGILNSLLVSPNPAVESTTIKLTSAKEAEASIRLIDNGGKTILMQKNKIFTGINNLQLTGLSKFSRGIYTLQVMVQDELITQKLVIGNR
ncbi:MAG: exo-alpha-sialidase [Bacteroidetes bacterium]|nr:exo-alpha-sialidase [Bacteroidota bacterium]